MPQGRLKSLRRRGQHLFGCEICKVCLRTRGWFTRVGQSEFSHKRYARSGLRRPRSQPQAARFVSETSLITSSSTRNIIAVCFLDVNNARLVVSISRTRSFALRSQMTLERFPVSKRYQAVAMAKSKESLNS